MTLNELRTQMLEAMKEKVATRGLVTSTATLTGWAQRADKKIYLAGVGTNEEPWRTRGPQVSVPAGASLDINDLANPPVGEVQDQVEKLCHVEWLDGGTWRPLLPLDDSRDRAGLEPATSSRPVRWYVEAGLFYLTPTMVADIAVRTTYLATYVAPTQDADLLLRGKQTEHHNLVLWTALRMLSAKDEFMRTPWDTEYKEALQAFTRDLQRTQLAKTRRIRPARHF